VYKVQLFYTYVYNTAVKKLKTTMYYQAFRTIKILQDKEQNSEVQDRDRDSRVPRPGPRL